MNARGTGRPRSRWARERHRHALQHVDRHAHWHAHQQPRLRSQRGFTLLSVLAAVLVLCVGLLGMVRATVTTTSAITANASVSVLAPLANAFWGVVQANPALLDDSAFAGTYTQANLASAPAALKPWLQGFVGALPQGAAATIATAPDAASGAPCSRATGCTVTLTARWDQVGTPGITGGTRTQIFFFQFF